MEPEPPLPTPLEHEEEEPLSHAEELFYKIFGESFEFLSSVRNDFDNTESPYSGTCAWVYEHPECKKWFGGGQSVLFLKGTPGCGKSVLLKAMLNQPERLPCGGDNSGLILRYFFSGNGDESRRTFRGFLISISFQLFHYATTNRPDLLADFLDRSPSKNGSGDLQERLTADIAHQCHSILLKILDQTGPVVLMLDGLDTCRGKAEIDGITKFLSQCLANSAKHPIRMCISSRHYPVWDALFLRHALSINMDPRSREDICLFVTKSLDATLSAIPNGVMTILREGIIRKAESCFLVATLLVGRISALGRGSRQVVNELEVAKLLEDVPLDVNDLWTDVLETNIKTQSIFKCVLAAYRPLAWRELADALSADFGKIDDFAEFTRLLTTCSGGLLATRELPSSSSSRVEGYVEFVNPTIRSFLESGDVRPLLGGPDASLILSGHQYLLRACIRTLEETLEERREGLILDRIDYLQSIKSDSPRELDENAEMPVERGHMTSKKGAPFFAYAMDNIFKHSEVVDEAKEPLHELAASMLGDGSLRTGLFVAWAILTKKPTKFLRFAIQLRLKNMILSLGLSSKAWAPEIDLVAGNERTALHWAVLKDDSELAHQIAECSAMQEAHQRKARRKWRKRRTYIKYMDSEGRTALHLAAINGLKRVLDVLLSCDRSIKTRLRRDFRNGEEASEIHLDAAEGLLHEKDNNGLTALHHAALEGHPAIVQVLLDLGAEVAGPAEAALTLEQEVAKKMEDALDAYKRGSYQDVVDLLKSNYVAALALEAGASGIRPVDAHFEANILYCVLDSDQKGLGTKKRKVPMSDLINQDVLDIEAQCQFKWIHLPANNMRWVERLMSSHFPAEDGLLCRILKHEVWTGRLHRGSKRSQLSFMRPTCQALPIPRKITEDEFSGDDPMVLFMPYLHWETSSKQNEMERFCSATYLTNLFSNIPIDIPKALENLTSYDTNLLRLVLEAYDEKRELNLLDELTAERIDKLKNLAPEKKAENNTSYIIGALKWAVSMLQNDREKELMGAYLNDGHPLHARRTLDQSYYHMLESTRVRDRDQVVWRYAKKMIDTDQPAVLMVDQLWLWTLGDTIITCFPERGKTDTNDPDHRKSTDVLESILANLEGVKNVEDLTGLILSQCSGALFHPSKYLTENFQFLDMFERSIANVADSEAACYKSFVRLLGTSQGLNEADIRKESELLREIKDIRDELKIIAMVFQEQKHVIGGLDTLRQRQGRWLSKAENEMREQLLQYTRKVESMQEEAMQTYESIKDLMDLQQTHASLSEARSTRKQGNTIMVFTIITIIFLPASFMASFFALNIAQFQRDSNSVLQLDYVVRFMLLFTIVVAVPFIAMAFLINNLKDAFHSMIHRKPKTKEVYRADTGGEEEKTEPSEVVMGGAELETKRFNLRWRYIRARGKKGGRDVV